MNFFVLDCEFIKHKDQLLFGFVLFSSYNECVKCFWRKELSKYKDERDKPVTQVS